MRGDLPQPHLLASPVGHHGLANTGNFLFFLHKAELSKFHEAFGLKKCINFLADKRQTFISFYSHSFIPADSVKNIQCENL